MKLKDLKNGQQFKFATGSDKRSFEVISEYPKLIYQKIGGHTHHTASDDRRPNKEVILINDTELAAQMAFTDPDGDRVTFTTETEADFVHVIVKPAEGKGAASALSRNDTIELINFLQRHLERK